jgi:hypothetical protein
MMSELPKTGRMKNGRMGEWENGGFELTLVSEGTQHSS